MTSSWNECNTEEEGLDCSDPLTDDAASSRTTASPRQTTSSHPANAASTAETTIPPARPELCDDGNEPPPPMGLAEAMLDAADSSEQPPAVPELIAGPNPPTPMALDDNSKKIIELGNQGGAAAAVELGSVDEENAPSPFNPVEFGGDHEGMTNKQDPTKMTTPTSEEIGNEVESDTNSGEDEESPRVSNDGGANNDTVDVDYPQPDGRSIGEEPPHANAVDTNSSGLVDADDTNRDDVPSSNHGLPEIEAYLVEERDEAVVIAIPSIPWWKQTRTRLLLCLVLVIVTALSIAFGVSLSSARTITEIIAVSTSSPPSISIIPTSEPTTSFPSTQPTPAPSVTMTPTSSPSVEASPHPSSSPSECVRKILSSKAQRVDLQVSDPGYPEVAVDGRNMVIVTQDSKSSFVYVMFYSLNDNAEWAIKKIFPEDYTGRFGSFVDYAVSLSGSTALVGFPEEDIGAIIVYEQNFLGFWEKIEDPFVYDDISLETGDDIFGFESITSEILNLYRSVDVQVDVDGDLACVSGWDHRKFIYLFRRYEDKWVEFDRIDTGYGCAIAGDLIVTRSWDSSENKFLQLYKYDKIQYKAIPLQGPIYADIGPLGLSQDYLVYLEGDDVFIYSREETNQTFTFLQQFNVPAPMGGITLDKDILAIGARNHVHIFSDKNGLWEETITFDRPYHCQISGRHLLATTQSDVYSFNIEDCAQAMPTHVPSLAPSQSPSLSAHPSALPSASISPTEICYLVEITIEHDRFGSQKRIQFRFDETSWELKRSRTTGDNELIQSFATSDHEFFHTTPMCLGEGMYSFTIYDLYGNGLCCDRGVGYYKLTLNGILISQGGQFEYSETTNFSLPFVSAPSIMPTSSQMPSTSLIPTTSQPPSMTPTITLPSMSPSLSTSPTSCYRVEIIIQFDDSPFGIEYLLTEAKESQKGGIFSLFGFNLFGNSNQAPADPIDSFFALDNSLANQRYARSLCLTKGSYIFSISDSKGDGLCCDNGNGEYILLIDGNIIAIGGEFMGTEEVSFTLPDYR